MLNWKRFAEIMGILFAVIILDLVLRAGVGLGIPSDVMLLACGVLIIALVASPTFDYFMLRKKQTAMYSNLKERALEAAKKKKGIVAKGDLGKMPSEWYGWFVGKLEADGLAEKDPRDKNQILFLDIIAETHTEDEIMEMNLPMNVGSKILAKLGDKGKKSEE